MKKTATEIASKGKYKTIGEKNKLEKAYEQGYRDCFQSVLNHKKAEIILGDRIEVINKKKESIYKLNIVKITKTPEGTIVEVQL